VNRDLVASKTEDRTGEQARAWNSEGRGCSGSWHEDGLPDESSDILWCIRQADILNGDAAVHDFLRLGGWRITGGRGRVSKGLAGEYLNAALGELPASIAELQRAIRAGRHRTAEQRLMCDVLAVFVAERKPRRSALAAVLSCDVSTLSHLNKRGNELLAEIRDSLEESNEKLDTILRALSLDPVREAELALEKELEDAA
jgi:hypothetical protein